MPLLDSNILIYSGEPQYAPHLISYITNPANLVSAISIVETLGYQRITPAQTLYFESLFKILQVVPVEESVIQRAVQIRQTKKLSLGDALIAATALVYDEELVTRNTTDFFEIAGLRVVNPIR